jgi:hypothetical protein
MAIACEVGELLEPFRWLTAEESIAAPDFYATLRDLGHRLPLAPGLEAALVVLLGDAQRRARSGQRGHQLITLKVVLPTAEEPELVEFLEAWQPKTPQDPREEMELAHTPSSGEERVAAVVLDSVQLDVAGLQPSHRPRVLAPLRPGLDLTHLTPVHAAKPVA